MAEQQPNDQRTNRSVRFFNPKDLIVSLIVKELGFPDGDMEPKHDGEPVTFLLKADDPIILVGNRCLNGKTGTPLAGKGADNY